MRAAFQQNTRRELGGPFFGDYFRSVRMPQTRDDGDSGGVSYVGNPIHGAASGFIWLDHEDGAHDRGWASRRSTGRVAPARQRGQPCTAFDRVRPADAKHRSATLGCGRTPGWANVVRPAGALGLMVAEDVPDRYLVVRIESRTRNWLVRLLTRMALNPSQTLSNTAQGRVPWSRLSGRFGRTM